MARGIRYFAACETPFPGTVNRKNSTRETRLCGPLGTAARAHARQSREGHTKTGRERATRSRPVQPSLASLPPCYPTTRAARYPASGLPCAAAARLPCDGVERVARSLPPLGRPAGGSMVLAPYVSCIRAFLSLNPYVLRHPHQRRNTVCLKTCKCGMTFCGGPDVSILRREREL